MKTRYQVVVGNVGSVYDDYSIKIAAQTFEDYKEISKDGYGKAGNELVTLFAGNRILEEYIPSEQENEQH